MRIAPLLFVFVDGDVSVAETVGTDGSPPASGPVADDESGSGERDDVGRERGTDTITCESSTGGNTTRQVFAPKADSGDKPQTQPALSSDSGQQIHAEHQSQQETNPRILSSATRTT
ncbi:MAG: hypothetical protein ACOC0P_01530 [Planctomycetota bacterium]